ncbi:hypothetical protein BCR34DRAFT_372922 [Clohesyomyces aquaticus]|uniref:Uncharacterized protein n=1 Tax=Clohesyomyces aquaticus TaxID=1231657 RepID=A0A1Y1ZGS8_9PLEO|nr:hypothetical protein BCR34DRAFT_372922 [Clohesyomyces aquaticus]
MKHNIFLRHNSSRIAITVDVSTLSFLISRYLTRMEERVGVAIRIHAPVAAPCLFQTYSAFLSARRHVSESYHLTPLGKLATVYARISKTRLVLWRSAFNSIVAVAAPCQQPRGYKYTRIYESTVTPPQRHPRSTTAWTEIFHHDRCSGSHRFHSRTLPKKAGIRKQCVTR